MSAGHDHNAALNAFREILQQAPVPCALVDADVNVLLWNREAEQLFGWRESEVVGRMVPGVHADDMTALHQQVHSALAGSPVRGVEVVRTRRDGTRVSVLLHAAVLRDHAGDVAGVMVMFTDMTRRRQVDMRMRNALKMEAVGLLAGGVAHDFNNLLTAIKGFSSLLLESVAGNDAASDCVDEIVKAAERAAALTAKLLAFSRRQVLRPQVVEVNARLEAMLPTLRELAAPAAQLATDFSANIGKLLVDPVQFEQVLLNLVSNARDAIEERGHITIRTSSVALDHEFAVWEVTPRPGRFVRVDVVDTGRGLDTLSMSRAFDPFYTTHEGRTGLGLATVFGTVKQSGGYVWITSTSSTGTTVSVYLPEADDAAVHAALERMTRADESASDTDDEVAEIRAEALRRPGRAVSRSTDAAAADAPVLRLVPGNSTRDPRPGTRALDQPRPAPPLVLTILLVDDDEAVRDMIRRSLERRKHTVLDARSGEEALSVVRMFNEPIDLLITDIRMPGMSGLELHERFMTLCPHARALFISGHAEDYMRAELRDTQVPFLGKPFTSDQLDEALRNAMGHPPAAG